jgi:hypothetical protein
MSADPIANEELDQADAELAEILQDHQGDAVAAIRTLLADCRHLRGEMVTMELCRSRGFARGWRPSFERD